MFRTKDIIAATPGPVRTTCGIELIATHGYSDIGDGLDTLVVAGGAEAEQASDDPSLVECVRSMAPRVRRVASICTGAFILAAAGLLHQRRVTTSELLARAYPSIDVDSSLLFARDGNICSSVGSPRGSISLWPWSKRISAGRRSARCWPSGAFLRTARVSGASLEDPAISAELRYPRLSGDPDRFTIHPKLGPNRSCRCKMPLNHLSFPPLPRASLS
jgi:DJ-1/PfpI family